MNPGHTYRALAALLSYPSAALLEHLTELDGVFLGDRRLHNADRAALLALLDALRQRELMDSESAYIDTFDRGSAASLNLFEHVHGDSRDRGQAMVDLLALYRSRALELSVSDLPDHLPVFLEFLSLLDAAEAQQQLQEIRHLIETIGATLTRRASPYAAVFQALLRLAGEKHPERLLADRQGAPVEEDTSAEAIDQAWLDQPVDFLGACSPQPAPRQRSEQVIKFQGRMA